MLSTLICTWCLKSITHVSPFDGEVANLLRTCCGLASDTANKSATSWQQVVVMEYGERQDTTDTTGFRPCRQLVTDWLRRNYSVMDFGLDTDRWIDRAKEFLLEQKDNTNHWRLPGVCTKYDRARIDNQSRRSAFTKKLSLLRLLECWHCLSDIFLVIGFEQFRKTLLYK